MADDCSDFSPEFTTATPEEHKEVMDYMTGFKQFEFIRVGPKGYFLIKESMKKIIYNFPFDPKDVIVATFPKSGTTWAQDLVWLLENNLDYEKAKSIPLSERFPFLEVAMFLGSGQEKNNKSSTISKAKLDNFTKKFIPLSPEQIAELPPPRYIKTHLPLSIFPPKLLDTNKVVYVARDPRDVAVSFYHHNLLMKLILPESDFKTYWKLFLKNLVLWTPYFDHVKEAWNKRNHPNMLFMFYEDMCKDLPAAIRRVAKFLGKDLSDEQVAALNEHLKFDNFKNNKSVNLSEIAATGMLQEGQAFVRKGKVGGWQDYFDEEMTKEADKWIADNLRDTDFRFPHF